MAGQNRGSAPDGFSFGLSPPRSNALEEHQARRKVREQKEEDHQTQQNNTPNRLKMRAATFHNGSPSATRLNRASFITRLARAISIEELVRSAGFLNTLAPDTMDEQNAVSTLQRLIHFILNDQKGENQGREAMANKEEHLMRLMASAQSATKLGGSGGVGSSSNEGEDSDKVAEWLVDHFFGDSSAGHGPAQSVEAESHPRFGRSWSRTPAQELQRPRFHSAVQSILSELEVANALKNLVGFETDKEWECDSAWLFSEALRPHRENIEQWDFDIFGLNADTGGHPLVFMGYHVFKRNGLIEEFGIDEGVLIAFLTEVEARYLEVPYHNRMHGTCVLQVSNFFLTTGGLGRHAEKLDMLGYLLSAIVHDVGHLGVNNKFLVTTGHDLAVIYNDKSVLENYHLAEAFRVLRKAECDVLAPLNEEARRYVRQMMVDCVLYTDMVEHFSLLAEFKDECETRERLAEEAGGDGSGGISPRGPPINVLMTMRVCIHAADLGNVAKPLYLALQWTERVMAEFYAQGDRERTLGIPISPNCDRENPIPVPQSQIGFIEHIVLPLYQSVHELLPGVQVCIDQLGSNLEGWREALAKEKAGEQSGLVPVGPTGPGAASEVKGPGPMPSGTWLVHQGRDSLGS